MVDNDREQFTLWKARATTDSKIVAISAPNCQNQTTAAVASSTSQLSPTSSLSAADAATVHTPVSKGGPTTTSGDASCTELRVRPASLRDVRRQIES